MFDKNFTCCFTGHREIPERHLRLIPPVLEGVIRSLVSKGYYIFTAGGALGFDTLAAEAVLSLKDEYPSLRLIVVAPYAGQPEGWSTAQQHRYERICAAADDYICLSAGYSSGCMKRRNQYIVDMSDVCVAYCTRERSGSSQTVELARRGGLTVVDILPLIEDASLGKG